MDRLIHKLLPALLLIASMHAHADSSFLVSPSLGTASISNLDGYTSSPLIRVDGSFHPIPQFAVGVFVANLTGFESTGSGNAVSIQVNGYGAGVTGRWPVHPHVQPYARLDYMMWSAESTGLGRTLAKDQGGSAGLALGVQFPIKKIFGVKAEFSGYNNVSGANIRQFSVGATFEF
jgi:hypothetical protein